jgi:hypothetical protein
MQVFAAHIEQLELSRHPCVKSFSIPKDNGRNNHQEKHSNSLSGTSRVPGGQAYLIKFMDTSTT